MLFTTYGKNIADDLTTSKCEQLSKMLGMIKKGVMMTKRDVFSEPQEVMDAWHEFNEGKKMLTREIKIILTSLRSVFTYKGYDIAE